MMGLDYCFRDGKVLLCKACCSAKLLHKPCPLINNGRKLIESETGEKLWRGRHCDIDVKSEPPIEDDYVSNPLLRIPTEQCCDGIYQCAVFDAGSESRVKRVPLPEDKMTIFELTRKIVDVNQVLAKLWIFNFDVNQETDKNGDYLIHIATKNGESQMPLLELLVKCYDADVNLQDKDGYTCLMIAANMGNTLIVEILVRCLKADPDVRHPVTGRTAIHYASQRNYLDVVSVLVKYGANYSIEDNDGILADELALVYHANECHRFINTHRTQRMNHLVSLIAQDCLKKEDVQASDLYLTDADGYTLITAAARMNSCHSLDWLIREPRAPINAQHEKSLKTALSFAARLGHIEAIGLLMRHGANAKIPDINGNLPLHSATIHHQVAAVTELLKYSDALTGLYKAQQLSRHPCIQREIKAAIQRREKEIVMPALLESCMSGDADRLYSILEIGDNINQMLSIGTSPLYLAVDNGHIELVKLLYELGVDVGQSHSQTGNGILHAACNKGHKEVTAFILSKYRQCANFSKENYNRLINGFNFKKETPLIIAANKGYKDVVELLLKCDASSAVLDPDKEILYQCRHYQGIQHIISKHRKQHTIVVMTTIAMWKPLKKLKEVFIPQFDHNLRNESGDTPLMLACRLGKLDVIHYLLQSAIYDVLDISCSNINLQLLNDDGTDCDLGAVLNPCRENEELGLDSKVDLQCFKGEQNSNGDLIPTEDPEMEQMLVVPSDIVTTSTSMCMPPDITEEQSMLTIKGSISKLLDSIASVSRGSVYTSYKHVNHLCAIDFDGCTAYHKTVQNGDSVDIVRALLEADESSINIQDNKGHSPLHLACQLKRKRIISALISLPFVDLNCRTYDGKLPEEMTTNKTIISLVRKARNKQPISNSNKRLSSMFSGFGYSASENGPHETHQWNTRFELFQSGVGGDFNMFV